MFSTNTGSMRGKTSASKMDWKDQQRYHQLQANLDNKEIHPNITHGYAGLRNQGATCYLNTVLQILFMTEEFRKAVESSPEKDDIPIGCALAQLFKDLESRTKIVTTEKITDALKIADVSEQQDAAKLFLKILNMVSPDMSKTFQGIMEYITICKNPEIEQNHSIMEQIDSFFSIGISMESQPSINVERCFKALFEPVFMVNEDQLYCTTCKSMMDMETNCKITKCPSVLVLHLKRFELDYNTMYYRKNTSEVEIPLHLLVKSVEDHKYDLYAVVKHEGSLRSGHYYADIKSCEDQKWYRFNDSSVQEIGDLENLHCNKAYLLLYKSAGVAEDTSLLLNESETPGQGSGSTEGMLFEDNKSERTEKRTKRANTRSHEDPPKHPRCRRDSENPQRNQQIEHTSTDPADDHNAQPTAREEQDQQNLQNNSDFISETEAHPSQPLRDDSTADRGTQSPEADTDHQPELTPRDDSTADRGTQSPEADTDHQPELTPRDDSTADRGTQSPEADTDHQPELTPRDDSTAEMQSNNGDSESQSLKPITTLSLH